MSVTAESFVSGTGPLPAIPFTMRQWRPSDVLSLTKSIRPYSLIILNQKLNRLDIFKKLWNGG